MITINQEILSEDIRNFILDGFNEHATNKIGYDGFVKDQIAFTVHNEGKLIGAVSVSLFYGALWIKLLFVSKDYRGNQMGTLLLNKALDYGKEQGCNFAFVETLSFQALEFYEKHGFKLDFTRGGFRDGISFHYLQKNL